MISDHITSEQFKLKSNIMTTILSNDNDNAFSLVLAFDR